MSIILCEKHYRRWDSDFLEECPECGNEPVCGGPDNFCLVAEARGEHCRCLGACAYGKEKKT